MHIRWQMADYMHCRQLQAGYMHILGGCHMREGVVFNRRGKATMTIRLLSMKVSTVKVHVGRSLPDYMCVGWFVGGYLYVRQLLADYICLIGSCYMRGGATMTRD